jgi:monofunctional biosynthetic peptidoglycan transglycosylase
MEKHDSLIDFQNGLAQDWFVINDGVMGGVSRSSIVPTDRGTGVFSGELSLENNGGFASIRAVVHQDYLDGYEALEMRVRGDGRSYQLRLRMDEGFDGVSYQVGFDTQDGEWRTLRVPFASFRATFRGRQVPDVGPLVPDDIQQVGFMLADKKPGPFSLEVEFVRAVDPREGM